MIKEIPTVLIYFYIINEIPTIPKHHLEKVYGDSYSTYLLSVPITQRKVKIEHDYRNHKMLSTSIILYFLQ